MGVLGQYAGMSSASNDVNDIVGLLESQGMSVLPLADALDKLEAALVQQPTGRMTARMDWQRFRAAYPHLARDTRFLDLISDAGSVRSLHKGAGLRGALAQLKPDERQERLQQELAGSLGRILDAAPEKIDFSMSIDQLGLDSLMLTQLQVAITRNLDINLPLIKLLKGPSIASLAVELLSEIERSGSPEVTVRQRGSQTAKTFTLADLEGVRVLSPWLIRGRGRPDASCRLMCFHSMGVGASLFTRFLLHPPESYDILAVQTPGRENRSAEPVMPSLAELAEQIVPVLLPLFDLPVVIWGHSYGGILAREVIQRLRQLHQLEPVHFVVTGTVAPHLVHLWQKREVMLKAMVADNSPEYLVSLSRYVDDPEFLKAIIEPMRRDYHLLTSYRFTPMAPLNCPITAFAARQDDMVYTDEIREWSRHTRRGFELIEVDGDHWFLNRNRDLITQTFQAIAACATGRIDQPEDGVGTATPLARR
jgi:surfactin synthase thioesterase subunit/acyl carrier protein